MDVRVLPPAIPARPADVPDLGSTAYPARIGIVGNVRDNQRDVSCIA
jgi:hypothetical protein